MWHNIVCMNELKDNASTAQHQEHKAKVLRMCAFQGERLKIELKSEYNQDIDALKSTGFNEMIKTIQNRYKPTQNQILLHYQV